MNTLPVHLLPLGIGVAIASAGTILERVGYEHPFEMSLGAALLAAGVTLLLRSTTSWLQLD